MMRRHATWLPRSATLVLRFNTWKLAISLQASYAVAYVLGSFGDSPAPRLWGMSHRRLRGTLPVLGASWGQTSSPRFRPRPLAAVVTGRPPCHWPWPDGWDSVSQPMSKIKFRRQASLSLFLYRNTLALSTEQGYYSTIPPQNARGCAHFSPHGDSKSSPIRATNAIDSATEVASYRKGDKPPRP